MWTFCAQLTFVQHIECQHCRKPQAAQATGQVRLARKIASPKRGAAVWLFLGRGVRPQHIWLLKSVGKVPSD
jgi:hypothetical protein